MDTKFLLKYRYFLFFFLFFLALFWRLYQLKQTPVYPDEITWMVNGKEMIYALKARNFTYLKSAWWNDPTDAHAISLPLTFLSGLSHVLFSGTGKYSLHLFSDIVAARLPLVFLVSTLPPLMFFYFSTFGLPAIGLLAALGYAINPIAIGIDRLVLNDSLLTFFSLLSILEYLRLARANKLSPLPGVFLGLAALTKPHGILPIAAWSATLILHRFKPFHLRLFLINTIASVLTITIIWPASWFEPIIAYPRFLLNQINLVEHGDPIYNFYFGRQLINPGWTYYFFQFFTRTPIVPLIAFTVFIFIAATRLPKYFRSADSIAFPLFIYFLTFFALIAWGNIKGGFRYALPLIPLLYFASSFVLLEFLSKIKYRLLKIAILAIFIINFAAGLTYHPNYYLYYNRFIGGPQNATNFDLVGLCFGNKTALEYLDRNNLPGRTAVLGCGDAALYHTSRPITKDYFGADYLIVESAFLQQFPNSPLLESRRDRTLVNSVFDSGVQTALIYR